MPERTPAQFVVRFLRHEAFYVIITLFVASVFIAQNIGHIRDEINRRNNDATDISLELPSEADANADLKQLRRLQAECIANRRLQDPGKALFLLWVERLQPGFFLGGATLALFLALRALINRRWPTIAITVRPAWSIWDCFKAAACWSAGGLAFGMIFGAQRENAGVALAGIFIAVFFAGIIINIVIGERRRRLRDLGLHLERVPQALIAAFAAFLILQPLLRLIEAAQFNLFDEMPIHNTLQTLLISNSTPILVLSILGAVVAAPIVEELFFRGLLQPVLQKWFGPWGGLILCAAFFAAVHQHIYVVAPLFALGLALGYIYSRTRSLVAPIALHMLCNGMAVLTLFCFRYVANQSH